MSNALNGAWILAVVLAITAYYLDIGDIRSDTVYLCVDQKTHKPYHSKRNVASDNCSPLSPLSINPDMIAGIRE